MRPAQLGPWHVVADQRGEGREKLAVVVPGTRQFKAPFEVRRPLTAHAALRRTRQEPPLQPQRDLPAVPCGLRGTAGQLVECFRQGSLRFMQSTAPPGGYGSLPECL